MSIEQYFVMVESGASESTSNVGPFTSSDKAEEWCERFVNTHTGFFDFTIHVINNPIIAMSDFGLSIVDDWYEWPNG